MQPNTPNTPTCSLYAKRHLVIDLKQLNAHLNAPHFRMFTISTIKSRDYAFKIDWRMHTFTCQSILTAGSTFASPIRARCISLSTAPKVSCLPPPTGGRHIVLVPSSASSSVCILVNSIAFELFGILPSDLNHVLIT